MSTKNNKAEQIDESQAVDKSKRSFAKIGAVAPVIMTLASKTALGNVYHCTVSGAQSGNHSGSHDMTSTCSGVGYSPGGFWQNADGGGANGSTAQWLSCNVVPFTLAPLVLTTTKVVSTTVSCKKIATGNYTKTTSVTTTATTTGGDNTDAKCKKPNSPLVSISTPTVLYKQTAKQCTPPLPASSATTNVTLPSTYQTIGYISKAGANVLNQAVFDATSTSIDLIKKVARGPNATATTFGSIFGVSDTRSVWNVLNTSNGSLEWHAIANYLNACLFQNGKAPSFTVYSGVNSNDIINLYNLAKGGPSFKSSDGAVIDANFNKISPNDLTPLSDRVKNYLAMLDTL